VQQDAAILYYNGAFAKKRSPKLVGFAWHIRGSIYMTLRVYEANPDFPVVQVYTQNWSDQSSKRGMSNIG
jgi:hypothetical protein